MWEDEVFYEDDEAAMAAYEEAIKKSKDGDYSADAMDDSDNDVDFEPVTSSRRGKAKPQRAAASRSKKTSTAAKPRKPRVGGKIQSSSPAPAPALPVIEPFTGSESGDKDTEDDSKQTYLASNVSAIPTPDIGTLKVSSSVGGSPSLEVASVVTMDTDEDSDPTTMVQALRQREQTIRARMAQLETEIAELEKKCGVEGSSKSQDNSAQLDLSEFKAPEWSVPIRANVMNFDWEKLAKACQFDVILMDPPWQLASQAPTRGVAIAYQQLPDVCIESLPIHLLQTNGFVFIWVINNKYTKAFRLMKQWGYTYVDDITWVKQTVNRRMAKGHGYYLQHAKETCLIGKKGADPPTLQRSVASDVIFSERRGQSQKPEEMYEIIEQLIPGGKYLEIFGRKNNLRDYWVTVGNEL
ncbi:hypothetical protein IW139_001508 [Coemansia sp. RSA 353]|nr:hypothetical protein GGF48_000331 [Coemansia sp. RSA 921]KAJ2145419.1 hypothetical protein IW142_002595 [Coemansia sp. RSA 564]KAJ2165059.1 hypothetical protein GGH15_003587 [Coemansia sp. RSA 562]KAJ2208954.1 hypothetical protein IW143_004685 [Coemansia sp. RSA 520]KAJ2276893.1 hypothetical protein J3F81_001182 [Coemansia sp. RSA 371]KAJ2299781.1 hypothetical protein IW139_001508 [Coemansia sp. RSA 353]KAJ2719265.1 hypothetical protein H4S00_003538 [Coemansia sp. D1744]KAJ2838000.1 hypot